MTTSIIDSSSQNIANEKEVLLTFCPKCNKYPFLSFPYGKQKEIYIDCDNCGYKNNEILHSYLDKLTLYTPNINTTISNEKNNFDTFCIKCKTYLSSSSSKSNTHQLHQVVSLSNIINTNLLNQQIEKGYYHINNYCNELKNRTVNELTKQINQLNYSYDNFQSTNNDILKLVELIITNYNIDNHNYYLMSSLNQIKSINIYEYNEDINTEGICNYFNNYNIISDEKIEKIKEINIIHHHTETVYNLILLQDGRLASCSWDKTIKIFDIKNNFHCDITIDQHSASVNYICQLENGKLISCSGDKTIKIFTIYHSSFHCDYTIQNSHNKWIYKLLRLTKNRFASCSNEIKIWNSTYPYNLIQTLVGYSEIKSMIQLKGKEKLISGGSDSIIRIWKLTDYNLEAKIEGISCSWPNSIIELEENKIMVGGEKKITILNLEKYEIEKVIENGELGKVYALMIVRPDIIICGSSNGTLGIFNKENEIIHFKKKSHQDIIKCILYLNEHQFLTCSKDKTIKLWDYQLS